MYIGAILTAFYSMRAVFLVFHGDPCDEAKELEGGHLAHGDHVNPATGEHEDTDVGFPGPDHQIAEREREMKVAMGTLAFLAIVAGVVQIPGVTHVIETVARAGLRGLALPRQHPVRSRRSGSALASAR